MSTDLADAAPTAAEADVDRSRWHVALAKGVVAYIVSRLMIVAGAGIVAAQRGVDANTENLPRPASATNFIAEVLTSWDSKWYLEIVRTGYPRSIPANITYEQLEARAAFFPLYPTLVRGVDWVLPGGDTLAALVANFFLGGLAIFLAGVLARRLFGITAAERTMILMAMFPGSYVLSFAYSEALLLVLAAGCLLALAKRQWLLAGILAALGTATRPNGVALAAACAVAAVLAIRDDREWRALVAPLLAPIGFVAFQIFLRQHTDERWAWFRVQNEAWEEGTSFGATAMRGTVGFLLHPLESPTNVLTAMSIVTMIGLLWTMWRKRLPWPMVTYVAVVLALMLLPATVTARPRFLYAAFPLFISAGAWWPDRDRDGWALVMALSAAGLVTLTGLYGVFGAIP